MVRPLGFQTDDRSVRRAGLDYWDYLDLQITPNWDTLTQSIPVTRHWYFTRFAKRSLWTVDFTPGDALVFGSESKGLPSTICDPANPRAIRIPTAPEIRSLNLANSVSIAVYECLRQLGASSQNDRSVASVDSDGPQA